MNLSRSIAAFSLLTTLVTTSCSKDAPSASSTAGALTANSALSTIAAKPFAKHNLNSSGFHFLNEFIRPEVRSRMDEEPTGDSDGGYEPSAMDPSAGGESTSSEPSGETQNVEPENPAVTEDDNPAGIRLDAMKFAWAKKSFGEAVKAAPGAHGVIVLYADENYYDTERLMGYIEEGRNRIAEGSGVAGDRLQVVFGGYRAVPQVELWVIREGESMPEFKPDDRARLDPVEN